MEIRQKIELRRLLVPELTQSLKILSLPLLDLKNLISDALEDNPFLEESALVVSSRKLRRENSPRSSSILSGDEADSRLGQISREASLSDVLLRQLGMFAETDEELKIGQEIVGNIDGNGYLKVPLEEISQSLKVSLENAQNTLKLIQKFEPPGVAARNMAECLLIQAELANEKDPLLCKIIESHLEDLARKDYQRICRKLKEPWEKLEPLVKKISKFNPKPGNAYSSEEAQRVIIDVIIRENDDEELEVVINDEDIPTLNINKDYNKMLKGSGLDAKTKEFLSQKIHSALEMLRAISRRRYTLRKIVEAIVELQQDAIRHDLSHLVPMTHKTIAEKLKINESTVCRAVMNKYAHLPYGTVSLNSFFTSHLSDTNGKSVSSSHIKRLIKELIDQEDKKHPLSDEAISKALSQEKNMNVSRRTVAKYRDELRLPFSSYRKER